MKLNCIGLRINQGNINNVFSPYDLAFLGSSMSRPSIESLQRFFSQFSPLNLIQKKYHSQLVPDVLLVTIVAGEKFIRKSASLTTSHFLLKGRVEIRESFNDRHQISNLDQPNVALEEQVGTNGTVKALTPCIVMILNNSTIDKYLLWNDNYQVVHHEEGDIEIQDDDLIDDHYQEDWEKTFFQSPLAANLSNVAIQNLMSKLTDIPVKENQTIIKARSPGDYFYLIKRGHAKVITEKKGPFKGQVFNLTAGDHFGDEALIAGTPRNASVIMTTDGVLGRLNIQAFNSLIREQLIPSYEPKKNDNNNDIKIVDVSFSVEYKDKHEAGSTNIPITHLRKKLNSLDNSRLYVLAPANDKRSELATYIMRQAGFNAYQLVSKVQRKPKQKQKQPVQE